MTRPLLYDFLRTLRGTSVIVSIIVTILISFVLFSLIANSTGPMGQFNANSNQILMYYNNKGYNFLMYSTNQFGQGISGVSLQINLTGSKAYSNGGVTNSDGLTAFTVAASLDPKEHAQFNLAFSGSSEEGQFGLYKTSQSGVTNLTYGQVTTLPMGNGVFDAVEDSSNSSLGLLQVFYAGPNGTLPNYSVYYSVFNSSGTGSLTQPSNLTESQMKLLGPLNTFHETYKVPLSPNETCVNQQCIPDFVNLALFSQNGTLLEYQDLEASIFYPPPPPPTPINSIATTFFTTVMGFFIPLIAILGSYSSYGKDRVTGTLESVLSRPVTRRGLSVARYLSTFVGLAVAVTISLGVSDVILWHYSGTFLDSTIFVSSILAFYVEVAAFVGLMFVFAHLVKSTGLLIGIGILLFIVFDFLWPLLIFLISAYLLHVTSGSAVFYQITIGSYFANPAQFISLVFQLVTNQGIFGSLPPAAYGITVPSLAAAGVLWIAVPFASFLFLAVKRD